jgi:hypothetical protein
MGPSAVMRARAWRSVLLRTSIVRDSAHADGMDHLFIRIALPTLWSCSVVAAGALGLARTPAQWLALTLVAVVPPAIGLHFARTPVRTTSEDIQDVLR